MESPIGDRNIRDIQVEKYKQIVPDNYIGRHDTCTGIKGNYTEDKYLFKLVMGDFRKNG